MSRGATWYISSVGSLALLLATVPAVRAADCSAITKYGIFDVRKTSHESDLIDNLITWLSVNEYKSEADSRSAAMRAGFIIPEIDIPFNADGSYGETHASSWSKATLAFLQTHTELHTKFSQEFTTANPNIVDAWRDCATHALGLICWAKQTDKRTEVLLSIEVRPVSLPLTPPKLTKLVKSTNLKELSTDWKNKSLNVNVTPLLFARTGTTSDEAANFVIDTNNSQYRCSADVPSLPPPAPTYKEVVTPHSVACTVGRLDMTGEGPKIGDKHLVGVHCHAPDAITGFQYVGCFNGAGVPNGVPCNFLERHAEYDQLQGKDVNLRFATNSADALTVKFDISYNTTTKECVANCDWKVP